MYNWWIKNWHYRCSLCIECWNWNEKRFVCSPYLCKQRNKVLTRFKFWFHIPQRYDWRFFSRRVNENKYNKRSMFNRSQCVFCTRYTATGAVHAAILHSRDVYYPRLYIFIKPKGQRTLRYARFYLANCTVDCGTL